MPFPLMSCNCFSAWSFYNELLPDKTRLFSLISLLRPSCAVSPTRHQPVQYGWEIRCFRTAAILVVLLMFRCLVTIPLCSPQLVHWCPIACCNLPRYPPFLSVSCCVLFVLFWMTFYRRSCDLWIWLVPSTVEPVYVWAVTVWCLPCLGMLLISKQPVRTFSSIL